MADERRLYRDDLNDAELQSHYAERDREAAASLVRLIPGLAAGDAPQPDFETASERFREGITSGDPRFDVFHPLLGPEEYDPNDPDFELWLDAMSASVQSFEDPTSDSEGHAAVAALLHDDWLAIAVSLAQTGPGADASSATLVGLLGEVGNDELPVVSRAFEYLLSLWQLLGVVDDSARVTELGCWAIPHVLHLVWTDYAGGASGEEAVALAVSAARADWERDPQSWDRTLYREAAMLLIVLAAMPHLVDMPDAADEGGWDVFLQAVYEQTRRTREGAGAAYLLGLRAEWRGDSGEEVRWARAALTADPAFVPALEQAAREAGDRGDAPAALDLLRRAGAVEGDRELETYLRFTPPAGTSRNAPCPCGSGRKFKACCLRGASHPLEARAAWLWRKVLGFVQRPPQAHAMLPWLVARVGLEGGGLRETYAPLLLDAMLFDGGQLDRFLEVRGPLLPADERDLASAWRDSRRAAYEVLATRSGSALTLRNLQTDEVNDVDELLAILGSSTLQTGDQLLGRLVTTGAGTALLLSLKAPARSRAELLQAVSTGEAEALFVMLDQRTLA